MRFMLSESWFTSWIIKLMYLSRSSLESSCFKNVSRYNFNEVTGVFSSWVKLLMKLCCSLYSCAVFWVYTNIINMPIRIIPTRIERTIITTQVWDSRTWLWSRLNRKMTDLRPVLTSMYQWIYRIRDNARATTEKIKIRIGWINSFDLFIIKPLRVQGSRFKVQGCQFTVHTFFNDNESYND